MAPEFDCLVVGAGLVGSVAARVLAAGGRSVLLVDAGQPRGQPRGDQRGLVLAAGSIATLERAALWPRLRDLATPIHSILVSERGAFGTLRLTAAELGLATLGWACPADHLLATCHAALAETSGLTVCWSTRFEAARATDTAIDVTLSDAAGPRTVRAKLLVGADGTDSAVRGAAAIPVERLDYEQQAIVAQVEAARPRPGWAFEHFTDEGPLAFIPQGGARYVSVQCLATAHAAAAAALDDAAYLALLARRGGTRLGELSGLGPRRLHPLARQRARRVIGPRLVLLGNAANTVHPNGAQGLNLGWRDVAALGTQLGPAGDPGNAALLARYARARRADHRVIGGFTHLLAQGCTVNLPGLACARRAAFALLGIATPLRRGLLRELTGLPALARVESA